MKLRTYTGEEINILGSVSVTAQSDTCTCTLPLLVVDGDGPSLIGRNWLTELHLDWKAVQPKSFNGRGFRTEQRSVSTRPRQDQGHRS